LTLKVTRSKRAIALFLGLSDLKNFSIKSILDKKISSTLQFVWSNFDLISHKVKVRNGAFWGLSDLKNFGTKSILNKKIGSTLQFVWSIFDPKGHKVKARNGAFFGVI